MMALCGYAGPRAPYVPPKVLRIHVAHAPRRACAVCLAAFEPIGPRLYTCSHECMLIRRRDMKRRSDAERMRRLRKGAK